MASYEKVLSINPDDTAAHNNLGNIWIDKGQPDRAIACYQKALALKPDFAEAHNNLSEAAPGSGSL